MGTQNRSSQRGGNRIWRRVLIGALVVGGTLGTGCGDAKFNDMKVDAQGLMQVKNTSWESVNGEYIHTLTLYNGSDVGAKDIVIGFRYLDVDGKPLGSAEYTISQLIEAGQSLDVTDVSGGPSSSLTRKVEYSIVKAKATWKGRKKGE